MATEHSPPEKRGLYGSLVQIGFPLGMALGTASFFALASLGDQQFMSWGWRVPFVVSAVLVVIGIFIRLRIDETRDFKRVLREGNAGGQERGAANVARTGAADGLPSWGRGAYRLRAVGLGHV